MAYSSATDGNDSESYSQLRERSDVVYSAIRLLEDNQQYDNIKLLGQGTYGDVFLMYDRHHKSEVAVKIVTSENISQTELVLWPKLQHRNIIELLDVMTLSSLEVVVFVMPVQKTTLNDVLYKKRFQQSSNALEKVKAWLYQILCGLEYLHSQRLCHLDMKADNILISSESVAMLCDFSFLNVSTKPLERYDLGLPYIYRPPEACSSLGSSISVDGRSYDTWSYGVMLVEIFTNFNLANVLQHSRCWLQDIYPTLYNILQENKFISRMTRTFERAHISKGHARMAFNFIHGFLRMDSEERMSVLQATQHPFLKKGSILAPSPDPIWVHEMSTDDKTIAEFNKKFKTIAITEENIDEGDENDHISSEETAYFRSPETDEGSENSLTEELSDEIDVISEEANSISSQENGEDLDVDIEDECIVLSSPEYKTIPTKFKSYKNSLQRLKNDKYGSSSSIKNFFQDKGDNTIEMDMDCDSRNIFSKPKLPSFILESQQQGSSSNPIEDFNEHNIMPEVHPHVSMKSQISLAELFSDDSDYLSEDSGSSESTKYYVNGLKSKEEPSIIDIRSPENMTCPLVVEKESSCDLMDLLQVPTGSMVLKDATKEEVNINEHLTECPSEEFSTVSSTDSKWATGDSVHSGNTPEKVSSTKYADNVNISIAKKVKSLRQRLGKLDHMFGEIEKEMMCEKCLNTSKSAEEKPTEVSGTDASGEKFGTGHFQNTFQDTSKDRFGIVNINQKSPSEIVKEADEESDNDSTVGLGRTKGRRKKITHWIRHKYLDMERIVRRWPYRIMKDPR